MCPTKSARRPCTPRLQTAACRCARARARRALRHGEARAIVRRRQCRRAATCALTAQVASLLLERRADATLVDSSGETAQDKAVERGHVAVMQLLAQAAVSHQAGARQEAESGGSPPAAPPAAPLAGGGRSVSELLAELDMELARAAATMATADRAQLARALALVAAARAA